MIDKIISEITGKMQKTVDILSRDLATIRTGKATPALVEHLKVDYHGIAIPLNQLASISVPEAKTILIQPWDRSSIRNIEKAILTSGLGFNPINDGNVIRIMVPPLTEERRKELTKLVRKRLEEARVALRNVRREAIERIREAERNKEISQDQHARASEQIQKLTESFIEKVNSIGQAKETEILEI